MSKIEESLENAPIVKKGDYNYVIHPITDGIPYIEPSLLEEVIERMDIPKCDRIVTMEAMGIPIATALSLKTGMPFTIIRKRSYGLEGEVSVKQVTGYSSSNLFINGINKGDEIVIVDDVLSTGGTLIAVVSALKEMGVKIKGIFIAVNKGNLEEIEEKIGMHINTVVDIEVNGKVRVKQH
ncbi:MAG: adenine phosphoribosyltransferase [Thermoplasmata archaeon]|jgi:adenine phosphoribosyltransferase|nr:MAG: purine phosphoribosyltransferase family protein [Thermoplasmata archaeon]RLF64595.1 MAG: adenine phosphoribosyltransferase [Thermoplasmata archaeon]